jgi:hypothetical protein
MKSVQTIYKYFVRVRFRFILTAALAMFWVAACGTVADHRSQKEKEEAKRVQAAQHADASEQMLRFRLESKKEKKP